LRLKLLGGNGQPVASNLRSTNPEAYQAYLQAEYFLGRGHDKEDLDKALAYTDAAIKLDGRYAPAWALRSLVQNATAEAGLTGTTEGFRKARDDAERAIALDPLRTNSYSGMGYLLYVGGRYDEAQAALQKALDLNPQAPLVHLNLGKILLAEGRPQQALAEMEKEPSGWGKLTGLALAYHTLGREQDSNAVLAALIAKHQAEAAYQIAQVYAYRGESDKSFQWLKRAYKQRDGGLPSLNIDPLFKNLRHDPRYAELLKNMRLPT
jgi:tetratricopeptide (TPR) repeat protein